LKLHYEEPLSNFAFSFNLRRYSMSGNVAAAAAVLAAGADPDARTRPSGKNLRDINGASRATGRGLHSSTSQLNLSRF
jgi:hypothetical protein